MNQRLKLKENTLKCQRSESSIMEDEGRGLHRFSEDPHSHYNHHHFPTSHHHLISTSTCAPAPIITHPIIPSPATFLSLPEFSSASVWLQLQQEVNQQLKNPSTQHASGCHYWTDVINKSIPLLWLLLGQGQSSNIAASSSGNHSNIELWM